MSSGYWKAPTSTSEIAAIKQVLRSAERLRAIGVSTSRMKQSDIFSGDSWAVASVSRETPTDDRHYTPLL